MKNIVKNRNIKNRFIVDSNLVIKDMDGKIIESFSDSNSLRKSYKFVCKFDKTQRSTFHYWFAHWCAYQVVALNLGVWKFRFLFHDLEKPWLKLFWPYKKVQQFHRKHNKHHMEYGLIHGWNKIDWLGLVIDYECSRYTKLEAPLDARETIEKMFESDEWKPYEEDIRTFVEPWINKLGL
jgi:hypothetical protein